VRQVGGVVLEGDEIRLAAYLVRLGTAALERRAGAVPAVAAALRDQLARFAAEPAPPQASATGEHANLPGAAGLASSGPRISVAAAAALAGHSPQHIRRLCRRGDLAATRPAGPDGPWEIDEGSAAAYARRRKDATCLHVSDSPTG